jgi:hypothetical protein
MQQAGISQGLISAFCSALGRCALIRQFAGHIGSSDRPVISEDRENEHRLFFEFERSPLTL